MNTGVAALLDSERKKICGVLGDSQTAVCTIECECPYREEFHDDEAVSYCLLKCVSFVMKKNAPAASSEPTPKGVQHE